MAYVGAHSDIGGGYKSGDLSDLSLLWIMKHFNKTRDGNYLGISDSYKKINNPIVHDSLWSMPLFSAGGEFRWATDSSKDYDKTKILNNFKHLELNWNDTKAFENPNNKKLDKLQNATEIIAKNKQKGFFKKERVPYVGNLVKDAVLMAANDENKIIAINDYLYWLKCHYGIDLKYTNKEIKSSETALSDKQLCSGIPLHKQVKK